MFFCISAAVLTVVMTIVLILKQLFWAPRPDPSSDLPIPPRFIFGKYVLPINGCTYLFKRVGSRFYSHFDSKWTQVNSLPMPKKWLCSRELGGVFSVFVWGQWRYLIHGEKRVRQVLSEGELVPSWAFFEPKTVLGKSCLCFLDKKEKPRMINLIRRPLSKENILRFASEFAKVADSHLDELFAGDIKHQTYDDGIGSQIASCLRWESSNDPDRSGVFIGSHSLRTFTLDIIDGPILGLRLWMKKEERDEIRKPKEGPKASAQTTSYSPLSGRLGTSAASDRNVLSQVDEDCEHGENPPDKNLVLLWVKRFQMGILGFKFTVGGRLIQLWRLNEYGRALNARYHLLHDIILRLVSRECNEQSDLKHHRQSDFYQDPLTKPIPLVEIAKRIDCGKLSSCYQTHSQCEETEEDKSVQMTEKTSFSNSSAKNSVDVNTKDCDEKRQWKQSKSISYASEVKMVSEVLTKDIEVATKTNLFGDILSARDDEGEGLSNVELSEVSMLLWFILDAGSAWTHMALYLLGRDSKIFAAIQEEVASLQNTYGADSDELFSETSLSRMHLLDTLIYEAIRLCPPFYGGMWQLSKTVSLGGSDNVQIPKRSHVLLSYASDQSFDLYDAARKNPFDLGTTYPNPNLFGFLPLDGVEVPLMVLQTKVFLISVLNRCVISNPEEVNPDVPVNSKVVIEPYLRLETTQSTQECVPQPKVEVGEECTNTKLDPSECRSWFSEMPIPEARYEIPIRRRRDPFKH